jgi:hypothetical protein
MTNTAKPKRAKAKKSPDATIPDYYEVKFVDARGRHYGILDRFTDEALEHIKQGLLIVEDAVRPHATSVPIAAVVNMPYDRSCRESRETIGGFMYGNGEYDDYVTIQHVKHVLAEQALEGDKLQVGHMFQCGVGDGYASYVVTKVNKKTCNIEWRGFCPDRWFDRMFGYGGNFRIEDVIHMVRPGHRRLFGGSAEQATLDRMVELFTERYGYAPPN